MRSLGPCSWSSVPLREGTALRAQALSGVAKTLSSPCLSACRPLTGALSHQAQGLGNRALLPALNGPFQKQVIYSRAWNGKWVETEREGSQGTALNTGLLCRMKWHLGGVVTADMDVTKRKLSGMGTLPKESAQK
jgi:hypothetical protein